MVPWHIDKFHDFRNKFAFYTIKKQLDHKFVVMFSEQDDWKFLVFSCIWCQQMLNDINIIFRFIFSDSCNDLQFKFQLS
jgi:hypothetical protein